MANKKLNEDDLVYYTHPDGHVQEMTSAERDALENLTVDELKQVAADNKVELTSDMKKADIIAAIEAAR